MIVQARFVHDAAFIEWFEWFEWAYVAAGRLSIDDSVVKFS
jgi:hypothetical protein